MTSEGQFYSAHVAVARLLKGTADGRAHHSRRRKSAGVAHCRRDHQGEKMMNEKSNSGSAGKIVLERTYVASVEDVWEL
jgi:hypothetical protein